MTILNAIRETQNYALSGAVFQGKYRCGFGITFNAGGYTIFAGPDSEDPAVICSAADRSKDTTVRSEVFTNNAIELVSGDSPSDFKTIYFEPPNPTTFIGASSAPGVKTLLNLRRKGAACPSIDCRTILITTAGQIQMQ